MSRNQENHATIKIKLNGMERPYSEENEIHDWQETVEKETAAASEEEVEQEDFDWILPNADREEIPEFRPVQVVIPEKGANRGKVWRGNGQTPLAAIISSVVLAIIVGLLFGSLILKIMKQTEDVVTINEIPTTPAAEKAADEKDESQTSTAMHFSEGTVSIVQGGVFSSAEAAKEAMEKIKSQHPAATLIEQDGNYFIFIGITQDLDTAKTLAQNLEKKGIGEVWAKEFTLNEKELQLPAEEVKILEASHPFFFTLVEVSASSMIDSSISDDIMKQGEENLLAHEHKIKSENVKEMHEQLVKAFTSMKTYKQSAAETDLVASQQALLNYLTMYNRLGS